VGGVEHGERAGGQSVDQPADGPTVPEQRRLRLPVRPEQPAQAADHLGTSAPATLHPGARHLHVRPAATATAATDRLRPAAAAGHLLVPAGPAFPPLTGWFIETLIMHKTWAILCENRMGFFFSKIKLCYEILGKLRNLHQYSQRNKI